MFNAQVEEMMNAQKQQFEPVLKWNAFTAQAFEMVARKNYEVAGDYLNFMVDQAKMPAQDKPVQDIVADFVEGTRAFSEKMAKRGAEYVELAKEVGDMAPVGDIADLGAVPSAAVTPAKKKTAA